jgi:putative membrane protein insertion efficiency factor
MLKALLVLPIRAYKFFLSPWLGNSCRFTPTCSSYAIEAIQTWGAVKGSGLAVARLGRCHPWCQGGFDPVPVKPSKIVSKNTDCVAPSHRGHLD